MKKHFCLLLAAVISIVLGCSKSDPENPEPEVPKQETITIAGGADAVPVLGTSGGSASVTFTASTAWSASVINTRASDWCSVSPTSGGAGAATITITAKENVTPDNRAASITITAGNATRTIKVEQKQKDALTVSQSSFEVPAEGKEIKVVAKSNVSFTHTISEDAKAWIKVIGTKALKDSTLTFEIAKNDNIDKRSGEIYLASGNLKDTVKVHQAGDTPSIVISKDEYVLKSEGETFEVEVASNVNASMNLVFPDGVEPWMAENTTRAMSTNKYVFTAQANEAYDSRSTMIIFANVENNLSDTVRVTQAQKDAIVVAKSEYEFGKEGGNLDFEILTNVDITVTIPDSCASWISQVETRALETKKLYFNIAACDKLKADRIGHIIISGGTVAQTIKVTQSGIARILEAERQALIEFYEATGGDSWKDIWNGEEVNRNWCTDAPVYHWYGIRTDANDRVTEIRLPGCFLSGKLPAALARLEELKVIQLNNNNLTGNIPVEYSSLKKLKKLVLTTNYLSGEIPPEIGNMESLEELWLHQNNFTGTIPESIMNLKNLKDLRLMENYLSGTVPESFYNWNFWKSWWGLSITYNRYNFKDLKIPGAAVKVRCFDNTVIDLSEEYAENKYTILFQWDSANEASRFLVSELKEIYSLYKNNGVEIIGWANSNNESKGTTEAFIRDSSISWPCFYYDYQVNMESGEYDPNKSENTFDGIPWYPANRLPSLTVVNTEGRIVFSDLFENNDIINVKGYLLSRLENDFKQCDEDLYTSTDYSKNGEVKKLQSATKGPGINLVFMGDAFTDRLIADGTYDRVMNEGMEEFFEVEPYKSFREYFNVYSITLVSENEVYVNGSKTALSCEFGGGSYISGDIFRARGYVVGALSAEYVDNATVCVILNSDRYAGTCYSFEPENKDDIISGGFSIGFVPYTKGSSGTANFGNVLRHEIGGHGFSKLADEYYYDGEPESEYVTNIKNQQDIFGWWKNVDFTQDSSSVRWTKFLYDERYQYDGLGVFEGGLTYAKGVWRPTYNSIMNDNTGVYNAPSREAIYYRIHKLAYGADWQYDYEKFVEYDVRNRMSEAQSQSRPLVLKPQEKFVPLHPPVVIPYSWREVNKQAR